MSTTSAARAVVSRSACPRQVRATSRVEWRAMSQGGREGVAATEFVPPELGRLSRPTESRNSRPRPPLIPGVRIWSRGQVQHLLTAVGLCTHICFFLATARCRLQYGHARAAGWSEGRFSRRSVHTLPLPEEAFKALAPQQANLPLRALIA